MGNFSRISKFFALLVLAIILVVVFALFLPNVTNTKERAIRVALFQSPASVALNSIEEEFESTFDATVDIELLPYSELQSKIEQQFITGTSTYDVIMVDCILIPVYGSRGMLAEVDPSSWQGEGLLKMEDLFPALDDYLSRYPKDGIRYGMPFMSNTHMMTYRPEILSPVVKQLGLSLPGETPDRAWSWDDYLKVAQAITKARQNNDEAPYGTALQARAGNSIIYEWYSVLFGFIDDSQARATGLPEFGENAATAMSFYADLYRTAPPSALTWAHEEETAAMCSGLTAMDATSNVELAAELLRDECQKSGELAFGYPPVGKSGIGSPDMGGYGLLLTKQSKNKDLATQFILWAASPEVHQRIVEAGGSPIRLSEIKNPEILEQFPYLKFYDRLIADSIYRARIPQWTEFQDILSRELDKVMQGEETPSNGVKNVSSWIEENINN